MLFALRGGIWRFISQPGAPRYRRIGRDFEKRHRNAGHSHEYSDVAKILTVSIGAVLMMPDETDTIDDYMFIADARLYKRNSWAQSSCF